MRATETEEFIVGIPQLITTGNVLSFIGSVQMKGNERVRFIRFLDQVLVCIGDNPRGHVGLFIEQTGQDFSTDTEVGDIVAFLSRYALQEFSLYHPLNPLFATLMDEMGANLSNVCLAAGNITGWGAENGFAVTPSTTFGDSLGTESIALTVAYLNSLAGSVSQ